MIPFTTKLVKKGMDVRHNEIVLFLRPDPNSTDHIIVQVDKGYFDNDISFWRENLQEERIAVADVEPCIKIRFITPDYRTLLEVTDFDLVDVDTYDGIKRRRVIADDCGSHDLYACHFHFEKGRMVEDAILLKNGINSPFTILLMSLEIPKTMRFIVGLFT